MAQEDPNRLVEWFEAARERWPEVRQSIVDWIEDVRSEPQLLLESRTVRMTAAGIALVVAALLLSWMARSCSPIPPGATEVVAETADFHVVCRHEDCAYHFVVHRDFGFHRFPVGCPRCDRLTGERARRCFSASCRGRWVPPEQDDEERFCPRCGERFDDP